MLRIAGLQKVSLVDFPGKICATVFLYGCNMHCPFCHNVLLVDGPAPDEEICRENYEYVFDYLSIRKKMMDGICITGGEPTLAGDSLVEFIFRIKEMGFAVKLDTNGTYPDRLEFLLKEGILDYVAMDVKTSLQKYSQLSGGQDVAERIKRSVEILKNSNLDYEFRTTLVPGFVDDAVMQEILELICGCKLYAMQNYRPSLVLEPEKVSDVAIEFFPTVERWVKWAQQMVDNVVLRGYGVSLGKNSYAKQCGM